VLIKQANNVAPAPVPAQIASAKSIFIANGPGDNFPAPDGGPARPYNEFYGAIKTWAKYALVSSPAEADLIFEISFTDSLIGLGGPSTPACSASTNPQLMLVIRDPKTRVPLWWFAEGIVVKERVFRTPGKFMDAFEEALAKLVGDVKKLTGASAGAKE
jgi:hypothetical protein